MRRQTTRYATVVLIALAAMLLTACPPRVRIGELKMDPGRYGGREISVAGNVSNSFGLMGIGAFEVDDGTGKIWVMSQNYGVPSKGARVGVKGRVIQGASLGGRNLGLALQATDRPKFRD
jgi:hypothetical protein